MKVAAAIFDLDGTVIDSEDAWGKAFIQILQQFGVKVESDHPEVPGLSIKESWKKLISKYDIKTTKTLDELRSLTQKEFEKQIPSITLIDGVINLITNLKESGVEVALATGTIWDITDKIIRSLGIDDLFDSITTGDEVLSQKPDPEIFIKAIDKLGKNPVECLVFENSAPGVTAAKIAGMKVVALDPSRENSELKHADLVIGSFSEITPQAIDSL